MIWLWLLLLASPVWAQQKLTGFTASQVVYVGTSISGIPTSAATVFMPVQGNLPANATETTANLQYRVPGPIHCFAMSCGLNAAAGTGSDAYTFTLRDDVGNASPALACTITTSQTECSAQIVGGAAIAALSLIDWSVLGISSPQAVGASCLLYCTVDAL